MTLGVGIIGVGIMGADHAASIAHAISGARLAAVFDTDRARAESVARSCAESVSNSSSRPGPPAAPDTRPHPATDSAPGSRPDPAAGPHSAPDPDPITVLDDPIALIHDPEVDAVIIASPDDTHERLVLACIEAGKPVLCEKPLAPSVPACQRIVEAEAAAGRRLIQVGFMRRFDPGYVEMKRRLVAGDIGRPVIVHCVHRNSASGPGAVSEMLLTQSAIHEMDIVRWLLDEEILGATVHLPRRAARAPRGLRDPQLVILRSDSGVLVDIEVFVNAGYGYDVRCEIAGDSGTLSLLPPDPVLVHGAGARSTPIPFDWRDRFREAYRRELQAWVDATTAGTIAGPDAWDGYAATAIAEASIHSLYSGTEALVDLGPRPAIYSAARAGMAHAANGSPIDSMSDPRE